MCNLWGFTGYVQGWTIKGGDHDKWYFNVASAARACNISVHSITHRFRGKCFRLGDVHTVSHRHGSRLQIKMIRGRLVESDKSDTHVVTRRGITATIAAHYARERGGAARNARFPLLQNEDRPQHAPYIAEDLWVEMKPFDQLEEPEYDEERERALTIRRTSGRRPRDQWA